MWHRLIQWKHNANISYNSQNITTAIHSSITIPLCFSLPVSIPHSLSWCWVSPAAGMEYVGCDSDWALAQVAQRGYGVSSFRDIQKLSGHGPGQPDVGGPAWAGKLDQMTSRGSFQYQLFCDSDFSATLCDRNRCSTMQAQTSAKW